MWTGMGRPTLPLLALAWLLAGGLAGCLAGRDADTAEEESLAAPVLTLVEPAGVGPAPAATPPEPARAAPGLYALSLDVAGGVATGLLAVPHGDPDTLVVVAHGWGGDAATHQDDLEALAERGALAAAMDFRGERGSFNVRAGVEDTVAITRSLQALHPGVDRTLLYGWSMGGEVALLAPLHAPAGTYDYLFVGAGVSDLESFWHEAPLARGAIENETGGPPTEVPQAYAERSPVRHAAALAAQGVARVFLVHGAADWPVPVEHSERMHGALAEAGQPVSYYVVTKDRHVVCVDGKCMAPPVPAGHEAGHFRLLAPFIEHRIARLPDPDARDVRGTYDGETGHYDPSDVG